MQLQFESFLQLYQELPFYLSLFIAFGNILSIYWISVFISNCYSWHFHKLPMSLFNLFNYFWFFFFFFWCFHLIKEFINFLLQLNNWIYSWCISFQNRKKVFEMRHNINKKSWQSVLRYTNAFSFYRLTNTKFI